MIAGQKKFRKNENLMHKILIFAFLYQHTKQTKKETLFSRNLLKKKYLQLRYDFIRNRTDSIR